MDSPFALGNDSKLSVVRLFAGTPRFVPGAAPRKPAAQIPQLSMPIGRARQEKASSTRSFGLCPCSLASLPGNVVAGAVDACSDSTMSRQQSHTPLLRVGSCVCLGAAAFCRFHVTPQPRAPIFLASLLHVETIAWPLHPRDE